MVLRVIELTVYYAAQKPVLETHTEIQTVFLIHLLTDKRIPRKKRTP
jgi:hypothetical protein